MSESEKPFTVSDRRHFTSDGRLRADAPPDEGAGSVSATEAPGAGSPAGGPAADAGPGSGPAFAVPPEDRPPAATGEERARAPADPAGEADLSQFLLSLGAQAGMLLSGQGLPEGTDRGEALAGARSLISILEMLKSKTEGRRTPREDEVLEGLLFELRMAYVEASRTGGS